MGRESDQQPWVSGDSVEGLRDSRAALPHADHRRPSSLASTPSDGVSSRSSADEWQEKARIASYLHMIRSDIVLAEIRREMMGHIERISARRRELQTQEPVDPQYKDNLYESSLGSLNICDEAQKLSCAELRCSPGRLVQRGKPKNREGPSGQLKPTIHFGKIGSSNTLMRSGEHRDTCAKAEELIAFEMEGAVVHRVLERKAIVVKAVCDYTDSHKNKSWHMYAADFAAAGAKALLSTWPRA